MNIIAIIALLFLVTMFLFIAVPLGVDFYKTINYGNGWVWQDKKGQAFRQLIKEENGCVYFIDVWDKNYKVCGSYSIQN